MSMPRYLGRQMSLRTKNLAPGAWPLLAGTQLVVIPSLELLGIAPLSPLAMSVIMSQTDAGSLFSSVNRVLDKYILRTVGETGGIDSVQQPFLYHCRADWLSGRDDDWCGNGSTVNLFGIAWTWHRIRRILGEDQSQIGKGSCCQSDFSRARRLLH